MTESYEFLTEEAKRMFPLLFNGGDEAQEAAKKLVFFLQRAETKFVEGAKNNPELLSRTPLLGRVKDELIDVLHFIHALENVLEEKLNNIDNVARSLPRECDAARESILMHTKKIRRVTA